MTRTEQGTHTSSFRFDLQGLRAIAVLLVVFAHAGFPVVPGGFLGVDVFFVLSGYLITRVLLNEFDQRGRIDWLGFYARRMKRLMPALTAMLLICFIFAAMLLSNIESSTQLASAPYAATWTSNIYFSVRHVGYFDDLTNRDLFLHTWSLGIEEQFYLMWPFVLLLQARTRIPVIAISGALSFAVLAYFSFYQPQAAHFLMPGRIWEFALGALVYLAFQGEDRGARIRRNAVHSHILLAAGLFLIVVGAIGLNPNLPHLVLRTLVPSVGAALIIAAGHLLPTGSRPSPLAHPVLVWIGDRSYSLYLWHWPVFIMGFSLGFKGDTGATLGLFALSVLTAIVSYRCVELPFWKGRFSRAESRSVLLAGVIGMGMLVPAQSFGIYYLKASDATYVSARWRFDAPTLACDSWYQSDSVEPCIRGSSKAKKLVVLIGDSVGTQWYSLLSSLYPEPEWRFMVFTKSACPLVDVDYYYPHIGKVYDVCSRWRGKVFDKIDKLAPDVVIVGNSSGYGFSKSQWIEGSRRLLARTSNHTGRLYVIVPTPRLSFDGPGCAARHYWNGLIDPAACTDPHASLAEASTIANYLRSATQGLHNAYLLDFNDLVCPRSQCNAVSANGKIIFRDDTHLTDTFVRSLIPLVRNRVAPASALRDVDYRKQ